MSVASFTTDFERALSIADVNSSASIAVYLKIIKSEVMEEGILSLKEKAIYELAEVYTKNGSSKELHELLISIRPYFAVISKAKTGKIMRSVIDKLSSIANYPLLISLCVDCIEWCKAQKRVFLKQQIECKLCGYYLLNREFQKSLKLVNRLIEQVKKLDDKHLLVEIHLIESRIHHSLHNIAKAKAALTACRAAANSIYIGPLLQAEIDMQAGSLANEEKDYKTSYSYFYEAFEGFDGLKDKRAPKALKYMLLSKVLNDQPNDVKAVISGKLALKYQSSQIGIMTQIAEAYQERDLHKFQTILANKNNQFLNSDLVIKNKLKELSNRLLEQNLLRLLEPFEKVEIDHIAQLIQLPIAQIQSKLSQMILDKKFHGILDQGCGAIIVFDQEPENKTYQNANKTIQVLNEVVTQLFTKSQSLD